MIYFSGPLLESRDQGNINCAGVFILASLGPAPHEQARPASTKSRTPIRTRYSFMIGILVLNPRHLIQPSKIERGREIPLQETKSKEENTHDKRQPQGRICKASNCAPVWSPLPHSTPPLAARTLHGSLTTGETDTAAALAS